MHPSPPTTTPIDKKLGPPARAESDTALKAKRQKRDNEGEQIEGNQTIHGVLDMTRDEWRQKQNQLKATDHIDLRKTMNLLQYKSHPWAANQGRGMSNSIWPSPFALARFKFGDDQNRGGREKRGANRGSEEGVKGGQKAGEVTARVGRAP